MREEEEEEEEKEGEGREERRREEEGTFHPASGLIPPRAFLHRCVGGGVVCTIEDQLLQIYLIGQKKSGLREATNHWLRKMGPDAAKKS